MAPAIITSLWCIFWLALVMDSRIRTLEHDMKDGCWEGQWGRWPGRNQSDGYQSVYIYISVRYFWSGKTGGLEVYHLLRGSSGRLGISAIWLGKEGIVELVSICNNASFLQRYPGVLVGSDGSHGTLYTRTVKYTLPIAQATGCTAYALLLLCTRQVTTYTHHQNNMCVTLFAGAAVML